MKFIDWRKMVPPLETITALDLVWDLEQAKLCKALNDNVKKKTNYFFFLFDCPIILVPKFTALDLKSTTARGL